MSLIAQYSKSTRQQHPVGDIIKNNVGLICMAIIYLTMGWFESVEVPEYDLDEYIPG